MQSTMAESREYVGTNDNAEKSFGMFSHDSTHVQLVMEAERQSLNARKKAHEILLKYTGESYEKSLDGRDDLYSIEDSSNPNDVVLYDDLANFSFHIPETCNDARSNDDGERDDDRAESTHGEDSEGGSQVFDHYRLETSTSEDIEHIGRCLEQFSPKVGSKRNPKNKISGQYQFKTINSVLAVVKAVDDASMQSFQSLRQSSTVSTRKASTFKKIFSFKKQSSSRTNSSSKVMGQSINTDAALVEGENPMNSIFRPIKDVKSGDLPPKIPQVSSLSKTPSASSSHATASNLDSEEYICAVSSVSDISMESIGEKARRQKTSLVMTSDNTMTIPVSICIKKKVRLKKMEVIKRKFSFSKGRF
jgi:hypothetical protein